jgi:TRAP-type C4-dicarboxylate transport system substrate-binding protein
MKRFTIALVTAGMMATSSLALAAEKSFNVLGQPLATGLIQKNKEQPFFENFAENTGVAIDANYKPIDVTGIKSEETLRVLKNGLFDIVSIRTAQAARDEVFLLGQDLVGLNPNYEKARQVYDAYKPHFAARLQEKFDAKLLGLWPFGPQVLFCKPEISGLADLKGKKVRVYDQNLSQFIESIGATPVPIGFSEVQQALSRGVTECAITGASSANTAGWPEVTEYFMPIGFQVGFNGYAINMKTWNKLSPEEQEKMQAAFDKLVDDIWVYSEELFEDALRCNVGKEPCTTVTKYNMKEVPVNEEDLKIVADAVKTVSFPAWSETCEKSYPGCTELWKKVLGPLTGIQ